MLATSALFLLILSAIVGIYSSVLYYNLYNTGIAVKGGRVSLGKIKLAKKNAEKNIDSAKLVNKCWRIYLLYLCLFYTAFLLSVFAVMITAIKK